MQQLLTALCKCLQQLSTIPIGVISSCFIILHNLINNCEMLQHICSFWPRSRKVLSSCKAQNWEKHQLLMAALRRKVHNQKRRNIFEVNVIQNNKDNPCSKNMVYLKFAKFFLLTQVRFPYSLSQAWFTEIKILILNILELCHTIFASWAYTLYVWKILCPNSNSQPSLYICIQIQFPQLTPNNPARMEARY